MKQMTFTHFGGKDAASTEEEARAILNKEVRGTNAFFINCKSDGLYPHLSILVSGEYAHVYYVPDSPSAGLVAYREDMDLDPDGITVFHINTPEEEMEIYNDYVISKERALQVLLAFMNRSEWPASAEDLPGCVEWDEL